MKGLLPDNQITVDNVLSDPEAVIISDEITSLEEVMDLFMRYIRLPRPYKRLSDYYSYKLFGCNVSDMFINMSYRYRLETPLPINETLFISEPDLYYNKKAFDEGAVNLCFVIGYSGSGKSVLTQEYEGGGIEKVSLDDVVCVKDHFTLDELKEKSDLLYSFFTGKGKKYYISREERDLFADRSEVFVSFIKYACKYASKHKEKRFILEGIWTYLFFDDPSQFTDYAVFMKGTSLLKSRLRRIKREAGNTPSEAFDRLFDFGIYAGDSMFRDSNVDKWRRYFEKKTETVLKPEDNVFTVLRSNAMASIYQINDCFVHGDKAGIKKIEENAKTSPDIDMTERTFVVEECRKALTDLKAIQA